MAKLKLRDSDLCWRCHRSKGTLLHMLYDCYLTQNLWKTIIGFVNKVLGTKFVQNPALCTLGIGVREEGLTVQQTLWCRLALSTGYELLNCLPCVTRET
uniref:Reverse transcriptase zinc-binding domain-containing protein n=1 Tax=Amphiprion ocellaris TaxID=80972 RepID=A0AAQ5YLC5_AMPOC